MYQILAYYSAITPTALYVDQPGVSDPNFSLRNGHFIFTEDYELAGAAVFGASITAAQIYDSTFNSINVPQLYPINAAIVPPSNPQLINYSDMPITVPKNEEIAVQIASAAAAAEKECAIIWIKPKGPIQQIPTGAGPIGSMGRVKALATVTTAITAGAWSTDTVISITNLIKGGSYCLLGVNLVCAVGIAFRVSFNRAPLYQGRKLLPGQLVTGAYANIPLALGNTWLGPMGYFDTFELPQISILGATTTASAAYTAYLDLLYMGPNMLSPNN